MRVHGFFILSGILFLTAAYAVRIWNVNHSEILAKYKPERVVYEEGTEVGLWNTEYYMDTADLTGYFMKVTGARVMETEQFLAQYHMTAEDLQSVSAEDGAQYSSYGLICLVTVEFRNDNWSELSEDVVVLDNFLLVGTDYFINPAMGSIQQIEGFNPELGGASSFALGSSRVFEVTLPYLIDTKSEHGMSLTYFLHSDPKLLLAVYPEESYLALPEIDAF